MMRQALFGVVLLFTSLQACTDSLGTYLPERIYRTVQSRGAGLYVVSYKEFQVINDYGTGVEKVREDVQKTKGAKAKLAVWEQAASIAVPRYLEAKRLVPNECIRGVVVTRSGSTEGGGGWAEFRCKD